jgi:anti-anti-sigma factor
MCFLPKFWKILLVMRNNKVKINIRYIFQEKILKMPTKFKILKPSGIIGSNQFSELRQEITLSIEEKNKVILLDFEDVTFLDSSSLGGLILVLKDVHDAGGKLFLASINEPVKILFNLVGIHKMFQIFPNRQVFEKQMKNLS